MPVYIEHTRPHNPSGLKMYDDLPAAAAGISRASHVGASTILADLRNRGRFYLGSGHQWTVVTAQDMLDRANWAMKAHLKMKDGDDVSDLPD